MSITTAPDANAILMGGGGAPTAKFPNPGDSIKGRVLAPPQAYQEREYDPNNPGGGAGRTYPSGDPIMAVSVDLATDLRDPSIQEDDGTRRLFIEGQHLKAAVRDAIRATGAQGLEVGGVIELTFTHREDPEDKRSRKYWQARYTPAGNATLMGGEQQPAAQAPPAQQQAPVQQQAPAPQPPAQHAAPAAPAPTQDLPAKVRQLASLGMDAAAIAPQVGLDVDVVQMFLNQAA